MKKLVLVLLPLLLAANFVFADESPVSVSAFGRAYYNVAEGDGTDNTTSTGPEYQRIGFAVHGATENAGFHVDVFTEGLGDTGDSLADFQLGDQAKMWFTFNPMVSVSFGRVFGDELRGGLRRLGSDWTYSSGIEEDIFERFRTDKGLLLDLKPVEGLYIGAAIDSEEGMTKTSMEDTYKAIQVAAGYTIQDTGLIRAQYIGSATAGDERIQVAFAYTGMEELLVDVGCKFPITEDESTAIGGGANYVKDALSTTVKAVFTTAATDADEATLNLHLDAGYKLDGPLSINMSSWLYGLAGPVNVAGMAYLMGIASPMDSYDEIFGVTPYVQAAYGPCQFRIGFTAAYLTPQAGDSEMKWAVPVGFQIAM